MLIRLIYASRAAANLTPVDVEDIVRKSQRNNVSFGVTGVLILSNGVFLQRLEGDHLVVNALYHRILLDPRHREPAVLCLGEIASRLYGGWAMGLVATTEATAKLFLKYSPSAEFDPYHIRPSALDALFAELVEHSHTFTGTLTQG